MPTDVVCALSYRRVAVYARGAHVCASLVVKCPFNCIS